MIQNLHVERKIGRKSYVPLLRVSFEIPYAVQDPNDNGDGYERLGHEIAMKLKEYAENNPRPKLRSHGTDHLYYETEYTDQGDNVVTHDFRFRATTDITELPKKDKDYD